MTPDKFHASPDFSSQDEIDNALASSGNADLFTRALALVLNSMVGFDTEQDRILVTDALRMGRNVHLAMREKLQQEAARAKAA